MYERSLIVIVTKQSKKVINCLLIKTVFKLNEMSLTSAKIMQRTNLLILPLVFASFFIGAMVSKMHKRIS